MKRLKFKIRFLGLSDVNWDKYDFHITPVLTLTRVRKEESNGCGIALEWGHWAVYVALFSIKQ